MSEEVILSAGIDIGTSTTQLIFSRMTIKNIAGFGRVPQTEIVSKEIFYRSNIYFTPLSSPEIIDGERVNEMIRREYELAHVRPSDLASGAVIITGESSRKQNARQVVEALSAIAGDFVVATAGPDLESILAGKGAGAAELSKKTGKIVANLDIGGGTTNICYFKDGEVYDTACLDIGGRLIKEEDGQITYIAEKMKELLSKHGMTIQVGDNLTREKVWPLVELMAQLLAQAVGLAEKTKDLEAVKTNRLITVEEPVDIVTFSGGVAACMEEAYEDHQFHDIGVLLAKAIQDNPIFKKIKIENALETMRATVIGAGNYSMNISGSTIEYTERDFPLKNLPIGKIPLEKEEDIAQIPENIKKVVKFFCEDEEEQVQLAIAMKGIHCPSFLNIQEMAKNIMESCDACVPAGMKLIVIVEADIGKALGQALKRINKNNRSIVCIDSISCNSGDYIDLGVPVAGGSVIPVVVKTLVFQG